MMSMKMIVRIHPTKRLNFFLLSSLQTIENSRSSSNFPPNTSDGIKAGAVISYLLILNIDPIEALKEWHIYMRKLLTLAKEYWESLGVD